MNKVKSLALLMALIISIPQLGVLVHAQAAPELYVSPSEGHGIDREPINISGCYFRPNSMISNITLYNSLTGQFYEFIVNTPVNELGCFGPINLKEYFLTNMSYGTYYVIVNEVPVKQPEPLVATGRMSFNESILLSVDASVLWTPATITAEFYAEGSYPFKGYVYTSSNDTSSTIGVEFTGEDGRNYRLNAWRVNVTQVNSTIVFQLVDLETYQVVFTVEVVPEEVDGKYVATHTFDLGPRLRDDLPNNKAIFTSTEDLIKLDLYYGGRRVEVLYALLNITYYNEETESYWEYFYEYPGNLSVDPETGIVYVEQYLGVDADIEWSSIFVWSAISEEAKLEVHATYLGRTLYFEDLYTVTPLLLINGAPAESGETYDFGVLAAGHVFTLTIYGSTPYSPVNVTVDNTLTLYSGLTGKDGNLSFTIRVPFLVPGEEHVITIEFQYDNNIYRVYITYIQHWYAYYRIINPITGEYVPMNKASASYYNETLVGYLDGKPFDYLGDLIEVYAEGLLPGADVVLKLNGYSDFCVCPGKANENGVLSLVCTIPSVPKDDYVVKLVVTDGIEVSIPWFNGSEYVYEPLEIYPKILVLKIGSYEIPVVVGNTVVRVFGTGFPASVNGFLVLLNRTDALVSVNSHTGTLWMANEYGILVNVLGVTPGLIIPVLEPGVYELRLARSDVVSEPSYIFIVNKLSEVATKEDINNLMSNITDLANSLREDIYNVRDSLTTQLTGIETRLTRIEDVLALIHSGMATKEDLTTALNTLLLEIALIHSGMATKEDLTTALNTLLLEINSSKTELLTALEKSVSELSEMVSGIGVDLASVNENLSSKIDMLESSVLEKITQAKNEVKTSFSEELAAVKERVEGAISVAGDARTFSSLSTVFAVIASVIAAVIFVRLRRFTG